MQGFRPIYKTPAYEVLIDEDGFGLEVHEYRTPGLATPYVIATVPVLRWDQFQWRTDWPKNTRVLCTDIGQDGSYWRFNGVRWIVDQEFLLAGTQGSVSGQVLKFANPLTGFRAFNSFQTKRFFAQTGRRYRLQSRVLKGSGAQNAPSTQFTLDTVPIYSFPWDVAGNMREQMIDTTITFADDLNIASGGAAVRVATSSNLSKPNTGTLATSTSTDSAAFPVTFDNIEHTIAIGITDTGSNAAIYGLLDLRLTCLA